MRQPSYQNQEGSRDSGREARVELFRAAHEQGLSATYGEMATAPTARRRVPRRNACSLGAGEGDPVVVVREPSAVRPDPWSSLRYLRSQRGTPPDADLSCLSIALRVHKRVPRRTAKEVPAHRQANSNRNRRRNRGLTTYGHPTTTRRRGRVSGIGKSGSCSLHAALDNRGIRLYHRRQYREGSAGEEVPVTLARSGHQPFGPSRVHREKRNSHFRHWMAKKPRRRIEAWRRDYPCGQGWFWAASCWQSPLALVAKQRATAGRVRSSSSPVPMRPSAARPSPSERHRGGRSALTDRAADSPRRSALAGRTNPSTPNNRAFR